ncbi:MAG: HPF/RaiA family ribosome-associated protein [Bryobacteraceae bacterium]
MKVTYTGKVELAPPQQKKVEAKMAKLGKLLDGRHERGAHVVLVQQRHLHKAEITVHYHDHPLVATASSSDPLTAICEAIGNLEKQAIRVRAKWRDTKRTPRKATEAAEAAERATATATAEAAAKTPKPAGKPAKAAPKVKRVEPSGDHKPMTVDEAVLEMEAERSYLVYRDADTDRVSVMIRRPDGNYDLIEA